jgi:hypothetical protein
MQQYTSPTLLEAETEDTLESIEYALAARERGDRRQFPIDINVPEDY